MKNNKFSIKIIEEGRMEEHEMKQIYGGDCNFTCPDGFSNGICLNIYRTCPGPYTFCDELCKEACTGTFTITIPFPEVIASPMVR